MESKLIGDRKASQLAVFSGSMGAFKSGGVEGEGGAGLVGFSEDSVWGDSDILIVKKSPFTVTYSKERSKRKVI